MSAVGDMKPKFLDKLNQNLLAVLTIVPGICVSLISCELLIPAPPKPTPQTGFHFYIVLSPINGDQAQQAKTLLLQAKGKGQRTAKVIVPGNRYTIAKFCESDNPEFPNSGIDMVDETTIKMQAVTGNAELGLDSIINKTVSCKATATSLVNLVPYLNNAAIQRSEKMVILIQAPWSKSEIEKVSAKIKEGMDKLSKSDKVEKIVVFDAQPSATDTVAKLFESFNAGGANIFISPATDSAQMVSNLQDIRRDVLKQKPEQ